MENCIQCLNVEAINGGNAKEGYVCSQRQKLSKRVKNSRHYWLLTLGRSIFHVAMKQQAFSLLRK